MKNQYIYIYIYIPLICLNLILGNAGQTVYAKEKGDWIKYLQEVEIDSKKEWLKHPERIMFHGTTLLDIYVHESEFKKAETLCERLKRACHENGYPLFEAVTDGSLGGIEDKLQKTDAAEAAYCKALELTEAGYGPKDKNVGDCLLALGRHYADHGQYEKADPAFSRASEIFSQTNIRDIRSCDSARCFSLVGEYYIHVKSDEKATEWYQKALHFYLKERNQRKYLSDVRIVKGALAGIYFRQGRFEDAENILREEITRVRKTTNNYYELAEATAALAKLFVDEKKLEAAALQYEEAIALDQKSCHFWVFRITPAMSNVASLYEQLNKFDRAELWHKRSIAIAENDPSSKQQYLLRSLILYQKMLLRLNRNSEAEEVGERIKSISCSK